MFLLLSVFTMGTGQDAKGYKRCRKRWNTYPCPRVATHEQQAVPVDSSSFLHDTEFGQDIFYQAPL